MNAPAASKTVAFRTVGDNPVRQFGLPAAERARRFAVKAGMRLGGEVSGEEVPSEDVPSANTPVVLANLHYACDPAWYPHVRDHPGTVLTLAGRPVLAHARDEVAAAALEAIMSGAAVDLPRGHEALAAEGAGGLTNAQLRKREAPFAMPLTPASARAAERASYDGAYKGVTDALTLYLWRRPAFHLTRWAAEAGLSPNFVTAVGAVFCALAFYLFWVGQYWPGIAAGFVFMVLDTVDGKLARCTGTSSRWGNVFDHGIDLLHPPFWWWAWAEGLDAYGTPLNDGLWGLVLAAIVIGYVLQRVIEGAFMRRFGMHIHVWERIDSRFRLITARRNPNMVILAAAVLFERPDIGLIGVAAWTILSFVFHTVRYAQAEVVHAQGRPIVSWLG